MASSDEQYTLGSLQLYYSRGLANSIPKNHYAGALLSNNFLDVAQSDNLRQALSNDTTLNKALKEQFLSLLHAKNCSRILGENDFDPNCVYTFLFSISELVGFVGTQLNLPRELGLLVNRICESVVGCENMANLYWLLDQLQMIKDTYGFNQINHALEQGKQKVQCILEMASMGTDLPGIIRLLDDLAMVSVKSPEMDIEVNKELAAYKVIAYLKANPNEQRGASELFGKLSLLRIRDGTVKAHIERMQPNYPEEHKEQPQVRRAPAQPQQPTLSLRARFDSSVVNKNDFTLQISGSVRAITDNLHCKIYLGHRKSDNRAVAVKEYVSGDNRLLQRFLDGEGLTLFTLSEKKKAYFLEYYGHYTGINEDGLAIMGLVMEKCDKTLLEDLKGQKKFSDDELRNIARQLIEGIACMHSERLYHRDIKPDNVFVTREGQIKIGDFNISFKYQPSQENMTTYGVAKLSIKGTGPYMAPELFELKNKNQITGNEEYKEASASAGYCDVFSLGITLLELCTGKDISGMNVKGKSTENDLAKLINSVKVSEIKEILPKMLCHNPMEREKLEVLCASRLFAVNRPTSKILSSGI